MQFSTLRSKICCEIGWPILSPREKYVQHISSVSGYKVIRDALWASFGHFGAQARLFSFRPKVVDVNGLEHIGIVTITDNGDLLGTI